MPQVLVSYKNNETANFFENSGPVLRTLSELLPLILATNCEESIVEKELFHAKCFEQYLTQNESSINVSYYKDSFGN